jgi:hypothetical protein
MARKTPKLDLAPEKRQVLSSDFNLFYKPQAKPEIAGVKELTASLNNFVNDAGRKMVIASEVKEQKINEAEAIKEYNKNRTAFNERVNNGTLPKEANPYFIDKYKELELNTKAQIFSNTLGTKYAEMKVSENPSPNAFQEFYESEIKKFVAENNLGSYKPTDLEKGFFQKTTGFKNQLFQTHVSSQMANISEQYKLNFQNNIQGMFDDSKSFEEIGATVSAFIIDKTANGLSKGSAQKYLLETLTDYADKTGDFEYAEKLLEELPKHIQLGTGKLGDIKGLKDDLFQIKDKLQERTTEQIKDNNERQSALRSKEFNESLDVADNYTTFNQAKEEDPNWNTYSNYKKDKIKKIFKDRSTGFGSQTEIGIEEELNELITTGKYEEAREFLSENQNKMRQKFYNDYKNVIRNFEISGEDPLLNTDTYKFAETELDKIVNDIRETARTSLIKFEVDPLRKIRFKQDALEWLADHPTGLSPAEGVNITKSEKREKFRAWIKNRFEEEKEDLRNAINTNDPDYTGKSQNNNDAIKVKPEDLSGFEDDTTSNSTNVENKPEVKKPTKTNRGGANPENRAEDPELSIDLAKVNIIPNDLSRGERAKFLRENQNTISQSEYERIFKKQNDLQLAKGNN